MISNSAEKLNAINNHFKISDLEIPKRLPKKGVQSLLEILSVRTPHRLSFSVLTESFKKLKTWSPNWSRFNKI